MKKIIYCAFLIVVLMLPLSCATSSDVKVSPVVEEVPKITGIDIQNYMVTVTVNKPFNYILKSPEPHRVVIELPDVSDGAFNYKIISDKAGITEIVPSQIESPSLLTKLEILIQTPTEVTSEHKGNTLIIRIKKLQPTSSSLPERPDNGGYVIGDEDVLQISVWGNPELNVQVPVRPDGMISFPLVGDVKARGVSPQELKAFLEKEISKYVKEPTVSVIVTSVNSFKVYVIGEGIANPGVVTLKRNTSLLQLIAQLGSLKNADLENSFILRDDKKLNIDFSKLVLKGDISQDMQLAPNDTIFIPDNFEKRITVVGEVKNPGTISYREGLTAVDAILNSGGFTEFAKQNDVTIVRKEGDSVKNIEARLKDVIKNGDTSKDVLLKPGDLIIIKAGLF